MATYYLATDGNDHHPGSLDAPFGTPEYAHAVLAPGDTLYVRGGEYIRPWWDWNWTAYGTSGNRILVTAYPGESVTFNNGTLYTWTWLPSTYGGCWSASIPGLGSYGSYLNERQWVPEKDRPSVEMQSSADFTTPSSVGGGQFVDGGGHLLYNIAWYDSTGGIAYFKSAAPGGVTQVTDPTTQLWTVANGTNGVQFSLNNSQYVTFSNITFKNAQEFHQQSGGMHDYSAFQNCTFTGLVSGFIGGGTGITINNCWLKKIGPVFNSYSGGTYSNNNLNWGIYFSGTSAAITNNLLTEVVGGWFQTVDGITTSTLENNVVYDCPHHSIIGCTTAAFKNNIIIQKPGSGSSADITYGDEIFAATTGLTYQNNYVEATSPFQFSGGNQHSGFLVTDNLLNVNTVDHSNGLGMVLEGYFDPTSLLDRNFYFGAGVADPGRVFLIDGCQIGGTPIFDDWGADIAGWRAGLATIITGSSGWEDNSVLSTNTTLFDCALMDALLAGGSSMPDLKTRILQYVRGIQAAANTTAGPEQTLARPMLGGRGSSRQAASRSIQGPRVEVLA